MYTSTKLYFMRSVLLFSILFLKNNICAQNFITKWNFPSAGTSISFSAETSFTPVSYTWTCFPSGNSGSGSFLQTTPGLTSINGLNIPAGNIVTLQMSPISLKRFYMGSASDQSKLIDVSQWGSVNWTSMFNAFSGCSNLNITATDIPNLSNVLDMSFMFTNCASLNGPTNINSWNTSSCTNMSNMFSSALIFNKNIGNWNTSSCTNFSKMFYNASAFNQNIGNWNTSSCTDMSYMFYFAVAFNQPIGNWNTSSCINMRNMFHYANSFNQPIGNWNTSACVNMNSMFILASNFNQDIGNWNTSSCNNMGSMFASATSFNQNIGNWNTSNCINMSYMLNNATSFNQDIGNWNTSSCINMKGMFGSATSFNQDISSWDVSSCLDLSSMFYNAISFNQDIGNWNVSSCLDMSLMFCYANSFNKNLGSWLLNSNVNMNSIFNSCGMDCASYSSTLIGFLNNNPTVTGREVGSLYRQYGTNAISSRNTLINSLGWTFSGDVSIGSNCVLCTEIPTLIVKSDVSCNGANDGSIILSPIVGTNFT